jgi:outer membrane protein assembly factor BamB
VQWTYATGDPIFGSPNYANGVVYIASTDGYLYAINANSGSIVWKSAFTLNLDVAAPDYCEHYNIGSPTIANGVLYIGGGVQYGNAPSTYDNAYYAAQGQSTPSGSFGGGIRMFAFNATTGASIWNQSRAGNTQPIFYPCYVNGVIYAPEFFEVTAMSATNPNTTGSISPVPDFSQSNRRSGNRTWAAWVGYQIQGSIAYADDLTGAKIYVGSDIGSIYCLNAKDGTTYSVYTAGGNVACSPAVWEGKMYIGTTEGILYCFDDSPTVDFSLWAAADKGQEMWNNETITFGGQLTSNPQMLVWDYDTLTYKPQPSEYSPALPNAQIQISLTKPDGTSMTLNATTDKNGFFSASYVPTEVGEWGWVAYYEGKRTVGYTYNEAYSNWNTISVVAAPNGGSSPTETSTPTQAPTASPEVTQVPTATVEPTTEPTTTTNSGLPMEYIYAIVAVVVIVVIAVGAYAYTKRKKA